MDVTIIAYGLTTTTQQQFAQQLSEQLNIPAEEIERAMDAVTRIELLRVSRNENRGGTQGDIIATPERS